MSKEAYALFRAWHDENADTQESQTGLIRNYAAKLPSHVARLALVLHCVEHPQSPISKPLSAKTMAAALTLGAYFQAHALRVFARLGVTAQLQDSVAVRVLAALGRLNGEATLTSLDDASGLPARQRDQALEVLERSGLVERERVADGRAGRPAILVRLTQAGNNSDFSNSWDEKLSEVNEEDDDAGWSDV